MAFDSMAPGDRRVTAVLVENGQPRAEIVISEAPARMQRVAAQGDVRPMAASREAMDDLKRILAGRAAFYSKAEIELDTSVKPLEATFADLRAKVRGALRLPL